MKIDDLLGYKPFRAAALESAAYEVDDFQLVSVPQRRLRPIGAGDDFAVQFHGDTIGFHSELLHERGDGGHFQLLLFTVNE